MAKDLAARHPDLTEWQLTYVRLVSQGTKPEEAAQKAGYTSPGTQSWRLNQLPHVQHAIAEERARIVTTYAGSLGLAVLIELAEDKAAPPVVRSGAAKWLAEAAGLGAVNKQAKPTGDKTLSEMTATELRDTMRQAKEEMDKAKSVDGAPVSAEMIDVTPDKPNDD